MAKKTEKAPKMAHISENIPGWCNFRDFYREIVEWMPENGVFVEIGVYWGQSFSYAVVEALNAGKAIDFVAIDAFPWTDEQGRTTLDHFLHHMAPLNGHYRHIKSGSSEAAALFADKSVDFVFIDANHTYEFVKADVLAWLPKVKPGGIIAGHDYNAPHEVERAVNEIFGERVVTVPSDDFDAEHRPFYSWKVKF